jgi:hypothetical protein
MSQSLLFIIEACCVVCEVVYDEENVVNRAPRMVVCKRRLSTLKRDREREKERDCKSHLDIALKIDFACDIQIPRNLMYCACYNIGYFSDGYSLM